MTGDLYMDYEEHGGLQRNPDTCTFVSGNDPCPTCPRLVTALHRCKLLQDEAKQPHTLGQP